MFCVRKRDKLRSSLSIDDECDRHLDGLKLIVSKNNVICNKTTDNKLR